MRRPGRSIALMKEAMRVALAACILLICAPSARGGEDAPTSPRHWSLDTSAEERILALHPDDLSPGDVRALGQLAGAPRIIAFQGSVPVVTMRPFAEFLIAMGYR